MTMKRLIAYLILPLCLVTLSGCGSDNLSEDHETAVTENSVRTTASGPITEPPQQTAEEKYEEPTEEYESQNEHMPETIQTEENSMFNIQITAGGKSFSAVLYNNNTAQALLNQLPLTLNMSELNGNEKYYYFDSSLPTDSENVGYINTGDIMLYGSDCLVLFYDSFSTPYSYTRLGYVDDPDGLANALGFVDVTVTFENS